MKEKIIREKNRTSMKKIVERAAAGWRLGAVESLDSGEWRIWSSSVRSWWNAAAGMESGEYGVRLFVRGGMRLLGEDD